MARVPMGGYAPDYLMKQQNQQSNFLNQAIGASNQANQASKKRETQILAIYDEMINRYKPGGSFETKSLQQIEKQKSRFVEQGYGQAIQGDISRGIYGTTESGARKQRLEQGYEADVAAPSRLRLEDVLMQRLSSAQTGKAGFLTGIEDQGPSLSQLYGMGSAAGSSGGGIDTTIIGSPSTSMQGFGANIGIPARSQGLSAKGTKAIPGSYSGALNTQTTPLGTSGSQKMQWEEYYQGKAGIPTSSGGGTEPFKKTTNYSAMYYNKTGQQLSQAQAYMKLQGN